jgi:hypothetical protein
MVGVSVAIESKKVSEASKRDGSVLKSLAVLTAVFFPATSIAVRYPPYPRLNVSTARIFGLDPFCASALLRHPIMGILGHRCSPDPGHLQLVGMLDILPPAPDDARV